MRRIYTLLFMASFLLTACGARPAAPMVTPAPANVNTPTDPPPTQVVSVPDNTPSAAFTPTVAPTSVPIPVNFGPDNFRKFVQVQTYRISIETALNMSISDLRLDAVASSPDGRYFAVGGCTGNWTGNCISDVWGGHSFLYILDAHTGEIITTLPETEVTVTGLAFSTDGEELVYAVNPDRIVIWDVASGQVGKVLWQDQGSAYRRVAIDPDGSRVAEVDSHSLRVWDAANGDLLTQKPAGNYGDNLPRFSADGSRLAVFSLDSGLEITVYDTSAWEPVTVISLPGEFPGPVAFSPDFKLLANAEGVGKVDVLLWDVETGLQVGTLHDPSLDDISGLGFTPDGHLLLVSGTPSMEADYNRPFSVWDVSAGQELGGLTGLDAFFGRIQFTDDGTAFLTGLSMWSLPDEAVLAVSRALMDYSAILNRGEYGTAAGLFQPDEWAISDLASLGAPTHDLPALLEFACTQDTQPCLPVRDVLYAGKEFLGDYGLLVRFTAPDGSIFVDQDGYDTFWVYAEFNDAGTVVFTSLPPFPRAP